VTRLGRAARLGVAFAAVLLASLPSEANADPGDEVTPFGSKLWADGASADYKFHADVPTRLRNVLDDVMQDGWSDLETNNSDGPEFNGPVTSAKRSSSSGTRTPTFLNVTTWHPAGSAAERANQRQRRSGFARTHTLRMPTATISGATYPRRAAALGPVEPPSTKSATSRATFDTTAGLLGVAPGWEIPNPSAVKPRVITR
jgi:hypothetical protein